MRSPEPRGRRQRWVCRWPVLSRLATPAGAERSEPYVSTSWVRRFRHRGSPPTVAALPSLRGSSHPLWWPPARSGKRQRARLARRIPSGGPKATRLAPELGQPVDLWCGEKLEWWRYRLPYRQRLAPKYGASTHKPCPLKDRARDSLPLRSSGRVTRSPAGRRLRGRWGSRPVPRFRRRSAGGLRGRS